MQHIAVVASPDAPGHFSLTEFSACMSNLAYLMNLTNRQMPPVLVMHVSDTVATRFGVARTGVIRHNCADATEPASYYEVWLVGHPDVSNYVMALLGVLEDHFVLDISSQERELALESAVLWVALGNNSERGMVQ
jgi:hypothetical protein